MRELLYEANYYVLSYIVEKEITDETVSIILTDTRKEPYKEIKRIDYRNIGKEYLSPFLSWYNVLFCSNNYGPAPDYDYMHRAVQEGKKTAATVYLDPDSNAGKELVRNLPSDCGSLPYGPTMIYVFHKGCLADYFDIKEIKSIYEAHGVFTIDWEIVKEYFAKPLSFFGDETRCGFSLQNGGMNEMSIITGLILGYPIESTVRWVKR